MSGELVTPANPVKIAIIGVGNRSRKNYALFYKQLKPRVDAVTICDLVHQHTDQLNKE